MDINDTSVKEGMSNYESLAELSRPERVAAIKAQHAKQQLYAKRNQAHLKLKDVFETNDKDETSFSIPTDVLPNL